VSGRRASAMSGEKWLRAQQWTTAPITSQLTRPPWPCDRLGFRSWVDAMWRAGSPPFSCSYGVVMHASRVLMNTLPSVSLGPLPSVGRPATGWDATRRVRLTRAASEPRSIPSLKMPVVNLRDSTSTLLHSIVH